MVGTSRMSEIVKTFETKDIKIVHELYIILFCGRDVAIALGYVDTSQAIRKHVEDEDKLFRRDDRSGQMRDYIHINECGLYSLIFYSKMPAGKRFKRWVYEDVLPLIRKTGEYRSQETDRMGGITHNQLCIRNETDLHYEVVKKIRKRFPHFVLVVQGGELQDTSEKRIDMWKKGFVGGQPDIMIMNPHRIYNRLCVELKTPGGTGQLSDKQRDVLNRNRIGWKSIVCDDLVSTVLELVKYAKGVRKVVDCSKRKRRWVDT